MPTACGGGVADVERSAHLRRRVVRCSFPLSPFNDGFSRSSNASYQKLPPSFFKLTVVKLDATSFDVQVMGTATVGELKQAVEDVFANSPNVGQGTISWSHVWGHFCLCFEGQKLINDKDYIRNLGITDGDQLHFTRHLSLNYKLIKRKSKQESTSCRELPLSGTKASELKEEGTDGYYVHGDEEEGFGKLSPYENGGDEVFIGHPEFKLAHLLKGWISYSKQWFAGMGKTKSDTRVQPSRFSGQFLKMGSKFGLRHYKDNHINVRSMERLTLPLNTFCLQNLPKLSPIHDQDCCVFEIEFLSN